MPNKRDSLGDRMKRYEAASKSYLTCRTPVIVRIDGKAFHTFTKGFKKPFDTIFVNAMQDTMQYLCENIQGCVFGYTQSDEISLVLIDYTNLESCAWFDNQVQKIVSVAASMATMRFNKAFEEHRANYVDSIMYLQDSDIERDYLNALYVAAERGACFDARAFNLPKEEVINYFIWRQQDATRNSINSLAQAYFSHKELQGKSCSEMQDMLMLNRNINWNDLCTTFKRGCCCVKFRETESISIDIHGNEVAREINRARWILHENIPIFTQDRDYINGLILI